MGDMQLPQRSVVGPRGKFADVIGEGCRMGAERFYSLTQQKEQKRFILTLGGDHSLGLSTVAAVNKANPNVGIIWVDAHADLHTPNTSASGNFHGMPVGLAMQLQDPSEVIGHGWLKDYPPLLPEQLVYIGLREVDAPERIR